MSSNSLQKQKLPLRFVAQNGAISLLLLMALVLSSCDKEAKRIGEAIQLTSEERAKDVPQAFHPSEAKLLITREAVGEDARYKKGYQRIYEVDFSELNDPDIEEIEALSGAGYPSYAANGDIVAIDKKGFLVRYRRKTARIEKLEIKNTPSTPVKPSISPDGERIAFLVTQPYQPHKIGDIRQAGVMKHVAYWAQLKDGEAKKIPGQFLGAAILTAVRFVDDASVFLFYQIVLENSFNTRINRVDITDGATRLALYADYPSLIDAPKSAAFFITGIEKKNHLTFFSKDKGKKRDYDLKGDVTRVLISPDGAYAAVSRNVGEEDDEADVLLIQTPQSFLAHSKTRPQKKAKKPLNAENTKKNAQGE